MKIGHAIAYSNGQDMINKFNILNESIEGIQLLILVRENRTSKSEYIMLKIMYNPRVVNIKRKII